MDQIGVDMVAVSPWLILILLIIVVIGGWKLVKLLLLALKG